MLEIIAIAIAILVAYIVIKIVSKLFWLIVKVAAASVIGVVVVTHHETILTFAQGYLQ